MCYSCHCEWTDEITRFEPLVKNFWSCFRQFKSHRLKLVEKLIVACDSLEKHHQNVVIAKATGSGVSVVGGILAAVGLAGAPFTAGLSTGLTVAGIALTASGTVTAVGSSVTETIIERKQYLQIKDNGNMGKMDEMLVEEVVNSMEDLKTEAIAIQKLAQRSCVTFMLHDFDMCIELAVKEYAQVAVTQIIPLIRAIVHLSKGETALAAMRLTASGVAESVAGVAENILGVAGSTGISVASRVALGVGIVIQIVDFVYIIAKSKKPSAYVEKLRKMTDKLLTVLADFESNWRTILPPPDKFKNELATIG